MPEATTLNEAGWPTSTERLDGCVMMETPALAAPTLSFTETSSLAAPEATRTVYVAASPDCAELIT